jgi:hypothetical protein
MIMRRVSGFEDKKRVRVDDKKQVVHVSTEAIAMETIKQVKELFPSSANLEC